MAGRWKLRARSSTMLATCVISPLRRGVRDLQDGRIALLLVKVERGVRVRRPASRRTRGSPAELDRRRDGEYASGGGDGGRRIGRRGARRERPRCSRRPGARSARCRESAQCHPANAETREERRCARRPDPPRGRRNLGLRLDTGRVVRYWTSPAPLRRASSHALTNAAAVSPASSVVNRASAAVKSSSDSNGGRSSVPSARATSEPQRAAGAELRRRVETGKQRVQQRRRAPRRRRGMRAPGLRWRSRRRAGGG